MKWKPALKSLPLSRQLLYLVLLGLLPLFYLGWHHLQTQKEWDFVHYRLIYIDNLVKSQTAKQALNVALREIHAEPDPFYLEHQLEALPLLGKECQAIEELMNAPQYTGNEAAEKRLAFIQGGNNRLIFRDAAPQSKNGLQETLYTLTQPVEVDGENLKTILSLLEDHKSNQPLLLITDFQLKRKEHVGGNQNFELTLNLLKKEFVK